MIERGKTAEGTTKPLAQDFFAGSGLVSLALSSKFNIVFANDISKEKAAVYRANHGENNLVLEDVAKLCGANIPAADLSWASFPCQDLSLAGNGLGLNGKRSSLVFEWLRCIKEMSEHPSVLVAENVIGFVSRNEGRDAVTVCKELEGLGYSGGLVMLDAIRWLPQSRKRVFLIAVKTPKSEVPKDLITDGPEWPHTQGIVKIANQLNDWVWWHLPETPLRQSGLSDVIEPEIPFDDGAKTERLISMLSDTQMKKLERSSLAWHAGYRRTRQGKQHLELRFDNIAGCLRTAGGGSSKQILVKKDSAGLHSRLLSCREAARLMGAPDSFVLPNDYNRAYNAMGDAVCVPVAEYLSEKLLYPLAMRAREIKGNEREARSGC